MADERDRIADRAELVERIWTCRRCPAAGIGVESLPVLNGCARPDAILVGQAPGIREADGRRPFAGDAGARLRRWLEPAGLGSEEAFYGRLHVTSVAKCFPGKRRGGSDLPPSRAMLEQCLPWLRRELALVPAPVAISVGAMALRALAPERSLDDAVGEELELPDGRPLYALPHPSGASPWPHLAGNAERLARALELIGSRLRPARGRAAPGGRA